MKPITVFIVALFVAGCAANETKTVTPSSPEAKAEAAQPKLDWNARLSGDVITLEVRDPAKHYRVEKVDLLGPAGVSVSAFELTRELVRDRTGGGVGGSSVGVGVGGSGGSRSGVSLGVGLGFPLGGGGGGGVLEYRRTLAKIRLPDRAAYDRGGGDWKIAMSLTDADGAPSVATVPAPRPPD
ncbi:MAG: hypothetical protein MI806_09680 [Minwuiales bacterium]|nr:hypothetical protein [Minwuiales bacterium]